MCYRTSSKQIELHSKFGGNIKKGRNYIQDTRHNWLISRPQVTQVKRPQISGVFPHHTSHFLSYERFKEQTASYPNYNHCHYPAHYLERNRWSKSYLLNKSMQEVSCVPLSEMSLSLWPNNPIQGHKIRACDPGLFSTYTLISSKTFSFFYLYYFY